jgi:simple sugar transport system ATP-binding protein
LTAPAPPLLEAVNVEKRFGPVQALAGASLTVEAGKVACLLGDNGAGKSTLIKILSGVERPDAGTLRLNGLAVELESPREALDRGIATVFQDLAVVAIMPVVRNFFLGREPTRGWGPFRRIDMKRSKEVALRELREIGIQLADPRRPIGTLSGGERQCVAIARAMHFGARILILDEPTSALGVREAEIVLRFIGRARSRGVGVILITHNAHHAFAVGDTFTILQRGRSSNAFDKDQLTFNQLLTHMAGGEELERLAGGFTLTQGGQT